MKGDDRSGPSPFLILIRISLERTTMITPSVCRALAVVAFLLLAFPAVAASPADGASQPTVGATLAEAKSLIAEGKAEEALAVLRALPRDGENRTEVLFQTGLAAIAAAGRESLSEDAREALLDEAIAALRAILIDRPDLVRVRLELARAFFLKREDSLSRQHFEQVLAGKPPPAVAANLNRFLAAMRARRQWSGYFGLSIAPDSNVNAASGSDIIYLDTAFGRLGFRRDAASKARSGLGVSVWGGGEYEYPLHERLRLRAGADAAHREYGGRRFDRSYLGVHLGPRWLADAKTDVSVLAEAGRQWAAGRPESGTLGVRIEAGRRLSRRVALNASAAWRERDYRNSGALDGPVMELSLGGTWVATPTLRVRASVGHDRERPKTAARRSSGLWGRLGADLALPLGFTVGASGKMAWTDYRGGDRGWPHYTKDGKGRADRTRTLSVSLLNRGFTLAGFSPQLVLVNEVRKTNAQTLDYKRNRAELRFVKQF